MVRARRHPGRERRPWLALLRGRRLGVIWGQRGGRRTRRMLLRLVLLLLRPRRNGRRRGHADRSRADYVAPGGCVRFVRHMPSPEEVGIKPPGCAAGSAVAGKKTFY